MRKDKGGHRKACNRVGKTLKFFYAFRIKVSGYLTLEGKKHVDVKVIGHEYPIVSLGYQNLGFDSETYANQLFIYPKGEKGGIQGGFLELSNYGTSSVEMQIFAVIAAETEEVLDKAEPTIEIVKEREETAK